MSARSIPPELARYHRQVILPGIGVDGQQRLSGAHALLVGCGALGTVAADALVRAGLGNLTIVDRDIVEHTNLQRQVLFDEADARAGLPKAQAAAERLARINADVRVHPIVADLNARNVESLMRDARAVIDGTDNFQTRYLLNDACIKHGVPLVYGGVVGTSGMTMTILPTSVPQPAALSGLCDNPTPTIQPTPCLRCLFPEPPPPGSSPTCDTAGVLGPAAGIVACTQAAETIKILLGRSDLVKPQLVEFDLWTNARRALDLAAIDRSSCPCCAQRRFEFLDAPVSDSASLCGSDAVQILAAAQTSIDLAEFAARMARAGHPDFSATRFMARGRVEGHSLSLFADGRAIVKGTTDPNRAKSIYARYVGA